MTEPTGLDLVDAALRLAESCDRPDLVARLRRTRARRLDRGVRVLVVGEFKQGKSQLVNALVGAAVCPVDDDVATAVPTVVSHAAEPVATLVERAAEPPDPSGEPDPPRRVPVSLEELAGHVSERGDPARRRAVDHAEVGLPRPLLETGLVLVDTPGVGGLGSAHAARTLAALPSADAVLLVSDASQELTEAEVEFLRRARELCPTVAGVLSKTDLYPEWRRVAELDRQHLRAAGVDMPLLAVSSALRQHAARSGDAALNAESGFPDLLAHLLHDVVGRAEELGRRSVAHDVAAVASQLAVAVEAELTAQRDPAGADGVVAELERARERADGLKKRSSRWQQTLNDGVADLVSDIEYDLRDRARQIARDAELIVDQADPGEVWEQIGGWVEQRVAAAAADNVVWAEQRARWLAGQVAEHFADSGAEAVPELRAVDPAAVLEGLDEITAPDADRLGVGGKLLTAMRGSYGGVLMFGLLTSLAGMALLNPISIGAGVLLGAKTLREDKAQRLVRRRAEAKQAVRRHLDDVVFHLGKDSKDALRQVQRTLRDHFTGVAEELSRSLGDSVAAAQRAARTGTADRERRVRELEQQLGRITDLQRRARALAPSGAGAAA